MSETRLELQIVENSKSAIAALDNLANALGRVSSAVSHGFANVSTKNIQRFGQAISNAVTQTTVRNYERLAQALESVSKAASKVPNLQSLQNTLGKVNDATSVLSPKKDERTHQGFGIEVERQIKDIAPAAKEAASANHTLRDRFRELFATTSGAKRNMGGLLSSFARIAKYRFLRAVLKEITEGFKFGFENMYQYAKYVGHSFAPAVDSAQDALFKMKNSIGAALAPAIQMLIPYLVQAVNWFINLLNIVNQFLSLLRGQSTWTRATNASASTLDKVKDSAKGASASVKELKGLLADWDELNIIQQETGGGGGGGGSTKADEDLSKYGLLFEQVDMFDERVQSLFNKFKEIVGWIKDSFSKVQGIAESISTVLQGWGVSKELSDIIGWMIGGIILPLQLTFDITTKFDEKFAKTGDTGWLLGSLLTAAFGAWVSGKLMKTMTGSSKIGLMAATIPLFISAVADFKVLIGNVDNNALSKENLSLAVLESLKVGAGIFLLSKVLGGKFMESMTYSVGATLITLGASVGIKAVKGMVDTNEITLDNVTATLSGYLTETVGAAMLMRSMFKNISWKKAVGTGMALGMLTLSAPIGVKAVKGMIDTGEITLESIIDFLPTAISFGATVGTLTNDITGNWKKATGVGIATGTLAITLPLAIKAVKDVVDADEITWSSIEEFLPSALGFSATVFSATQGITGSWSKAAETGIGAGIMTLAIPLAVKTYRNVVDTSDIDFESLKTFVEGAIPFAVGTATMTGNWKTGVDAGLLAIAVPIGIKAFKGVLDKSELSESRLKAYLSLELASIGSGISIVRGLQNAGMFKKGAQSTVAGAAGVNLLSLGVLVGVKAYRDVVDTGEFTKTELAEGIASSLIMGIGAGGLALAAGSTLSAAALIAGGVAIATGIVLGLAIKFALEKSKEQDAISWGNVVLTEQEIKDFVYKKLFSAKAKVALELTTTSITATKEEKAKVETAAANLFVSTNTITLGIDTTNSLIQGVEQFNIWRETIRNYAKTQTTELKTSVSLSPVIDDMGNDVSAKFLGDSIEGWNLVTGAMDALGKELSDAMIDSATGEMKKDWDVELVRTIMAKVGEVNKSVMGGQMISNATNKLQAGLMDIGSFSRKTAEDALALYEETQKQIRDGYISMFQQDAVNAEYEASYLRGLAKMETDVDLKTKYEKQAEILEEEARVYRSQVQARVEAAMKENTSGGYNYLQDWFLNAIDAERVSLNLKLLMGPGGTFEQNLRKALKTEGISPIDAVNQALLDTMGKSNALKEEAYFAQKLGISAIDMLVPQAREEVKNILSKIIPEGVFDGIFDEEEGSGSGGGGGGNVVEYELDIDESSFAEPVPAADMSLLTESVDTAATNVQDAVNKIRSAFQSLNGLAFSFSGDMYSGSYSVTMPTVAMAAEGGLFTTGQMFIARESGPEMVGTMGNRTAVANNNQIVAGIAGGVASGQSEQNALLRQQNDLLRRILEKESTVRLEPSAMLGKVNRRSEEMYSRNTGR